MLAMPVISQGFLMPTLASASASDLSASFACAILSHMSTTNASRPVAFSAGAMRLQVPFREPAPGQRAQEPARPPHLADAVN